MHVISLKSSLLSVSCATLIGCQTAPQNASLQCGAGGAAVGFLLCKALGHSDSQCLKAAAVIGVGGAAICYGYASNLERRRKELAGRENDLDARIQYVRGLNEDGQQLNADLAKKVAGVKRRTDELVAQVKQSKVTQEQLAEERKKRDTEVKAAKVQVDKGNEALAEVEAYRAQRKASSPNLDAEIAKQKQLLADAQRQVDLLAAQRARV